MSERRDRTESLNTFYGKHEVQVATSGEADLHRHLAGCKKNPGHSQFIPSVDFRREHLPEGHRDGHLYDLVKIVSDLTVRIDVKRTSSKRPEFWPETKVPYPFHDIGDTVHLRTGSGKLRIVQYKDGRGMDGNGKPCDMLRRPLEKPYTTCPCDKCGRSKTGSKTWWECIVHTARHLIYDKEEAAHTSVRLFYDQPDSSVVILGKVSLGEVDTSKDKCELICVTCDSDLGRRLFDLECAFADLWEKVIATYQTKGHDHISFIVSHPHVCLKQVSVGQWIDYYKVGHYSDMMDFTRLTYNTCTCPGSSGSRVYCIGFICHVHSGALNSGINYSSVGFKIKPLRKSVTIYG